ncbi:hypothetical protein H0H87_004580 [Tephrocybe sp. NHM501043]|nr:hypothetical protein H0H87_004580 [Tephrocybe sp. NHM501043]
MAKRKANKDDFIDEDEEVKPSKRTQKKNNALKEKSDSEYAVKNEEEQEEEESDDLGHDEPLPKKNKTDKKPTAMVKESNASDDVAVKTTSEGEKYVELGKKKRATVRNFKGTALLDVREFYTKDDNDLPGKKGISLTMEQVCSRSSLLSSKSTNAESFPQWETLKKSADVLDGLFAAVAKKKI